MLVPADAAARGRRLSKLEQMIADGRARPAVEDPGDLFDGWPIARLPKGTAAALIDADREED
jgi:hypothetical protein